jgi:hypothetical protein
VCLINILGKNLVLHYWGAPHLIILFFQHSLIFNITSITFYYSSNKKITTKQNFLFFYTKHSYFFIFLKNKTFLLFFVSFNFCYSTKPKPKRNRLSNTPRFMDDVMIFSRAKSNEAAAILKCLTSYSRWYGQCINFSKFAIFFSQNCKPAIVKYLGFLVF